MGQKYSAALTKARSKYTTQMTPERAGAGYTAKMTDIAVSGFNDYVISKVENSISLKQYLGGLVDDVVTLIDANTATGDPTWVAEGFTANIKKLVTNIAIMKLSDSFTTSTTPEQIETAIKNNVSQIDGIKNK